MKPFYCTVCGDEVGLGGQLLPTGPMCAVCGDRVAPEATPPTNCPEGTVPAAVEPIPPSIPEVVHVAPRAAEEVEQRRVTAPDVTGDRAGFARSVTGCVRVNGHPGAHTTSEAIAARWDAVAIIAEAGTEAGDVDITHLRDFDRPQTREPLSIEVEEWITVNKFIRRTPREIRADVKPGPGPDWAERASFVVVLEWRHAVDTEIPLRDVGPGFTPRSTRQADRQAALNTARFWARSQAKKLRAVPPMGYRPAREIS